MSDDRIVYDETQAFQDAIPVVPVVPFRQVVVSLPKGSGRTAYVDATRRLQEAFPDEWVEMSRQALLAARISPLSYAEAVDRIIGREQWKQADLSPFYEQLSKAVKDLMHVFSSASTKWAQQLRDAGLIADPGEQHDDPRARALKAVQNRHTGPARPSGQAARRPRRHQ